MTDTRPTPNREPTTEAGRRLLADVREVVVHGVTDRIPPKGFGFAWHVRNGILAIESEARATATPGLREAAEAVLAMEQGLRVTQQTPAPDSWWEIVWRRLNALRAALSASGETADRMDEVVR